MNFSFINSQLDGFTSIHKLINFMNQNFVKIILYIYFAERFSLFVGLDYEKKNS